MDEIERRKKRIDEPGAKAATEHSAVSKGVAVGELKGRPLKVDSGGRAKPSVADAIKLAAHSDRAVGRDDLPLPPELDIGEESDGGRSLGLRVEVSGDRVTVLDSLEVDVSAAIPRRVRGTDFLTVQTGDEILAISPLIDPGIAFGIADPGDPESRGHREIPLDSYELTIRVSLDSIERLSARDVQGTPDRTARPESTAVEILLYHSPETTDIEPQWEGVARGRNDLRVVASSGPLTLESLRGTGWADARHRREDVKPRPDTDGAAD